MDKLRSPAVALLLALAPAAAFADDYRVEVNGGFVRNMPSAGALEDVNTFTLGSAWYFAPVSTVDVPLAEAAYLGRASNLSAIAARFDWSFEALDTHLNAQAARVAYYIPDTRLYASVGVSRGQSVTAVSSAIVQKDYVTTWFGSFGFTPLDGLLITTSATENGWDPNISARYVHKLPNGHFYAANVSVADPDRSDTNIGVDFDYFVDLTWKVGAGFNNGADRFSMRTEKFFMTNFSVGGEIYTDDFGEGLGINASWRF